MSKSFRIILYFLLFILLFVTLGNFQNSMPFIILITIAVIFGVELTIKKKNQNLENTKSKICKYCQKEIDINASVCPYCKCGLTFNTNTSVLIFLVIIIGFLIFGIFSNNAPLFIKKTVCGLGIRTDFPYCYYIELDK